MSRKFLNGLATNALQVGTATTAGYVLTGDASGNATYQIASAGVSYKNFVTLRIASSTATTTEKAAADYVCTGTGDEVNINTALGLIKTTGGRVELSEGVFNLANPIAFTGGANFADNPAMYLVGQGVDTTTLAVASGINAINISLTPKGGIQKLRINYSGTSDAIHGTAPTAGTNDRRGFWMMAFEDIKIQGDFSTNTGWAINIESPFRSTFKRIQTLGGKNGIWIKSTYASFNPGNLVFESCHQDLALAGGTAYFLQSADTGGFLNIMTFVECDCIDTSGSATASIGWRIAGSTTTYFTTRDILVLRSNIENFTYAVKLEHSANIEFNANYVAPKTGGYCFYTSTDSVNNQLRVNYLYAPSPNNISAIYDQNTDPLKPNYLHDSFARAETGGTITLTKTVATVLGRLNRDSDGTGVYPAEWQGQTSSLIVKNAGTELFRGTRSINFTGTGVSSTNTNGDVTVTVTAGSGSGITRSITSITAATTAAATASTDYVYFITGTTTLTLPTAVSNTNRYSAVNNDPTLTTTIATTSSQTINGSTTITLVPGQSVDLISNNTNWSIF